MSAKVWNNDDCSFVPCACLWADSIQLVCPSNILYKKWFSSFSVKSEEHEQPLLQTIYS